MVESSLRYSDSKTECLRCAAKFRLNAESILDDLYNSSYREERIEFDTAGVYAKVRVKLEGASENGHEDRMEAILGPYREELLEKYGVEMPEE